VNPSFSLTLGYPPEDMEGIILGFIHPDDIDKTNKEVANLATVKQLVLKIDTVK
jgi:hypothetical protein